MRKTALFCLFFLVFFCFVGCKTTSLAEKMPENFAFSIRWNTYGTSFYNSRTGTLVKSADATHPEDYTAQHHLTGEELTHIYRLIRELEPDSYPDLYDPYKQEALSEPPHPITLTVFIGDTEKQIKVDNASYTNLQGTTKKGARFLSVCGEIIALLTESEAWQALPEYEFFYE